MGVTNADACHCGVDLISGGPPAVFSRSGRTHIEVLVANAAGPVVGLVLLLLWLMWRGQVNPSRARVGDAFLRYLGLLFVPAAVGVALFLPLLRASPLTLAAAILESATLPFLDFSFRIFS